ncbi:MAG TPA: RDD family protein [Verrucomicrobiae bacterium]|jgi:uncharacterized RDD family membrane protein YckC
MKIAHPLSLLFSAALGLLCSYSVLAQDAGDKGSQGFSFHRDGVVTFGHDAVLKTGDTAEAVVVISGSAIVDGRVKENVVVVGGNAQINDVVDGDVVVVMGDVHLGPKAVIHRDLIVTGGKIDIADGAKVEGQTQEVSVGDSFAPVLRLRWLSDWVENCAFKFRPLSLNVKWIWWVAGGFFLLYLIVAVLFRNPVEACANQLANRPATTFAVGIMAKLLVPVLCVLFIPTIILILAIPFVLVGAMLSLIVGKVALLEHIGTKIAAPFGVKSGESPLARFLLGIVLLTLLYLVPVLGLLTALVFSTWGFGAGVTAAWIALRREKRPATPAPPPQSFTPPPPASPTPPPGSMPFGTPPIGSPPFAQTHSTETAASAPPITPPTSVLYPRAGFWERMGAGFLDWALLSVVIALTGGFGILAAVAYFAGMWAWKGTTVGGIVLNLQVVRENGQPLGLMTALVRSAAAVFSVLILFLGFFWIGWDNQKQGWHDKIAGTVVVRLPKAIALVCI